jgi:hypothetical protein
MKKCANCGFENPDDETNCKSCSTDTFVGSSPEAAGGNIISPEEQHFWERMTFRQFAIFFIRFEAIWFLAYAIDEATYLPSFFAGLHRAVSDLAYSSERNAIFWAFVRIVWHVAASIACIRYADRIASWLVRDVIPRQGPNKSP